MNAILFAIAWFLAGCVVALVLVRCVQYLNSEQDIDGIDVELRYADELVARRGGAAISEPDLDGFDVDEFLREVDESAARRHVTAISEPVEKE